MRTIKTYFKGAPFYNAFVDRDGPLSGGTERAKSAGGMRNGLAKEIGEFGLAGVLNEPLV